MSGKFTTERFIEKATAKHGDRYSYESVKYVSHDSKVSIKCKIHGEISQTPESHLDGSGCSKCGIIARSKSRISSSEKFIDKAVKIHGDKYNYNLVRYINNELKVVIECSIHGEFLQTPHAHLDGSGCKECGFASSSKLRSSSTEEFADKANLVHSCLYNYSKVNYKNSSKKVIITCKIHGEFLQTPHDHLSGQGCKKCGNIVSSRCQVSSTEEFADKANLVHDCLYDYSKVDYKNSRKKVIITCKIHGEFLQTPSDHISGSGCRQCANIVIGLAHFNPNLTYEQRVNWRIIDGAALKEWRSSVFKRDNFTCQKCLKPSGKLEAHHILPWSKFPEVRFDIENGITFCSSCHDRYHSLHKLLECNHKTIFEFIKILAG